MSPKKGITLGELAKKLNAELVGNPEIWVKGLNTLAEASQDEISFLSRRQYIKQLDSTKAGAIIIGEKYKIWLQTILLWARMPIFFMRRQLKYLKN